MPAGETLRSRTLFLRTLHAPLEFLNGISVKLWRHGCVGAPSVRVPCVRAPSFRASCVRAPCVLAPCVRAHASHMYGSTQTVAIHATYMPHESRGHVTYMSTPDSDSDHNHYAVPRPPIYGPIHPKGPIRTVSLFICGVEMFMQAFLYFRPGRHADRSLYT